MLIREAKIRQAEEEQRGLAAEKQLKIAQFRQERLEKFRELSKSRKIQSKSLKHLFSPPIKQPLFKIMETQSRPQPLNSRPHFPPLNREEFE